MIENRRNRANLATHLSSHPLQICTPAPITCKLVRVHGKLAEKNRPMLSTEKPISILTCNAHLYTIMKKLRAFRKERLQALCSPQTTSADRAA